MIKVENLFAIDNIFDGDGLFTELSRVNLMSEPIYPLVSGFINSSNSLYLNEDYFTGFSADKYFSPLAVKMLKKSCDATGIPFEGLVDGTLTDLQRRTLMLQFYQTYGFANIIYNRFGSKWKHIWDALNTAYNPLENYSMLEERTPDLTKTTNGTGSTSTDSQTGIFGFNSSQSNPSGTIDGNQTDTITDRTETETGTETLERSGNIGVTTSQQMLQSEFEVRKYDFYKEIYKDIDSILCLKIY